MRLTILLLTACYALSMTGNALLFTTSALVGQMLAPAKGLSTLPLALQLFATTAATVPASLLMRRFGRRAVFIGGALTGIVGAVMAAWAVLSGDFLLFCAGCIVLGSYNATSLFYRFAAGEASDERFRNTAISLVTAGGVFAAVAGPQLARFSKDWGAVPFAGSYVAVACLPLLVAVLAAMAGKLKAPAAAAHMPVRPLGEIMRQPDFAVALAGGVIGFAIMSFLMTATPLAMTGCGLPFDDAAFVIQWHILGMFVPSFFTGHLVNRFGVLSIMLAGCLLSLACVGVNLSGTGIVQFWVALVLLGVGWNFLYVGATILLTRTYRPGEQAKTQAINEFLVSGMAALASLSSGLVQHAVGWQVVNLSAIAPLLVAAGGILYLALRQKAVPA